MAGRADYLNIFMVFGGIAQIVVELMTAFAIGPNVAAVKARHRLRIWQQANPH